MQIIIKAHKRINIVDDPKQTIITFEKNEKLDDTINMYVDNQDFEIDKDELISLLSAILSF